MHIQTMLLLQWWWLIFAVWLSVLDSEIHAAPVVDTTICKSVDELDFSAFPADSIDLYYINLERRTDRNTNIQAEFKLHHILPPRFITHRFEAIDGKTHVYSAEEEALFKEFYAKGLGNKSNVNVLKANSMSHLGIWRKIEESKVPLAIVVQDDVQFKNCFVEDLLEVFVISSFQFHCY